MCGRRVLRCPTAALRTAFAAIAASIEEGERAGALALRLMRRQPRRSLCRGRRRPVPPLPLCLLRRVARGAGGAILAGAVGFARWGWGSGICD